MIWIRFEPHSRYHAVLWQGPGYQLTYCGRYAPLGIETSADPAQKCGACKVRVSKPYLLPIELRQKLEQAKGAGV